MSAAVTRQVEINGTTYNLAFKFGTMRVAETEIGRSIADWGGGLDVLSAVFWAALQPAHKITREGSDNLVDHIGVEALSELIADGVKAYMGGGDETEGNAPKAKKGKT